MKSAYKKIREPHPEEEENMFTELWNIKALPTVVHFAWKMLLNKVSTRDNLVKRGVNVLSSQCIMCGNGEESVQYLFYECNFTWTVWKICDKWVDLVSVSQNTPKEHFQQFRLPRSSTKGKEWWRCMWIAIVWTILTHKNDIIFKNKVKDPEEIFNLAQVKT